MSNQGRSRGTVKFSKLRLRSKGDSSKCSPSIKTQSISKYFTRTTSKNENPPNTPTQTKPITIDNEIYRSNCREIKATLTPDDDDFKSPPPPPKKLANIFTQAVAAKPAAPKRKNTRKGTKSKNQNLIQKTLEDNFRNSDVDPEHLQLAIALSKSVQDSQGSCENDEIPEFTSTQEVRRKARVRLQDFVLVGSRNNEGGDATRKTCNESQKRKKKSRFQHITPTLMLRTEEDRKKMINDKISEILQRIEVGNEIEYCGATFNIVTPISEDLKALCCSDNNRIFNINNIDLSGLNTSGRLYTRALNFPPSEFKTGSLLKRWEDIPGREVTPPRYSSILLNQSQDINNLKTKTKSITQDRLNAKSNCDTLTSLQKTTPVGSCQSNSRIVLHDNNSLTTKISLTQAHSHVKSNCSSRNQQNDCADQITGYCEDSITSSLTQMDRDVFSSTKLGEMDEPVGPSTKTVQLKKSVRNSIMDQKNLAHVVLDESIKDHIGIEMEVDELFGPSSRTVKLQLENSEVRCLKNGKSDNYQATLHVQSNVRSISPDLFESDEDSMDAQNHLLDLKEKDKSLKLYSNKIVNFDTERTSETSDQISECASNNCDMLRSQKIEDNLLETQNLDVQNVVIPNKKMNTENTLNKDGCANNFNYKTRSRRTKNEDGSLEKQAVSNTSDENKVDFDTTTVGYKTRSRRIQNDDSNLLESRIFQTEVDCVIRKKGPKLKLSDGNSMRDISSSQTILNILDEAKMNDTAIVGYKTRSRKIQNDLSTLQISQGFDTNVTKNKQKRSKPDGNSISDRSTNVEDIGSTGCSSKLLRSNRDVDSSNGVKNRNILLDNDGEKAVIGRNRCSSKQKIKQMKLNYSPKKDVHSNEYSSKKDVHSNEYSLTEVGNEDESSMDNLHDDTSKKMAKELKQSPKTVFNNIHQMKSTTSSQLDTYRPNPEDQTCLELNDIGKFREEKSRNKRKDPSTKIIGRNGSSSKILRSNRDVIQNYSLDGFDNRNILIDDDVKKTVIGSNGYSSKQQSKQMKLNSSSKKDVHSNEYSSKKDVRSNEFSSIKYVHSNEYSSKKDVHSNEYSSKKDLHTNEFSSMKYVHSNEYSSMKDVHSHEFSSMKDVHSNEYSSKKDVHSNEYSSKKDIHTNEYSSKKDLHTNEYSSKKNVHSNEYSLTEVGNEDESSTDNLHDDTTKKDSKELKRSSKTVFNNIHQMKSTTSSQLDSYRPNPEDQTCLDLSDIGTFREENCRNKRKEPSSIFTNEHHIETSQLDTCRSNPEDQTYLRISYMDNFHDSAVWSNEKSRQNVTLRRSNELNLETSKSIQIPNQFQKSRELEINFLDTTSQNKNSSDISTEDVAVTENGICHFENFSDDDAAFGNDDGEFGNESKSFMDNTMNITDYVNKVLNKCDDSIEVHITHNHNQSVSTIEEIAENVDHCDLEVRRLERGSKQVTANYMKKSNKIKDLSSDSIVLSSDSIVLSSDSIVLSSDDDDEVGLVEKTTKDNVFSRNLNEIRGNRKLKSKSSYYNDSGKVLRVSNENSYDFNDCNASSNSPKDPRSKFEDNSSPTKTILRNSNHPEDNSSSKDTTNTLRMKKQISVEDSDADSTAEERAINLSQEVKDFETTYQIRSRNNSSEFDKFSSSDDSNDCFKNQKKKRMKSSISKNILEISNRNINANEVSIISDDDGNSKEFSLVSNTSANQNDNKKSKTSANQNDNKKSKTSANQNDKKKSKTSANQNDKKKSKTSPNQNDKKKSKTSANQNDKRKSYTALDLQNEGRKNKFKATSCLKQSIIQDYEKKSSSSLDLLNEDYGNTIAPSVCEQINMDQKHNSSFLADDCRKLKINSSQNLNNDFDLLDEDCSDTAAPSVYDQINMYHKHNSLYLADDCKKLKINSSQILNKDFEGNDKIKQKKKFKFQKHHSSSLGSKASVFKDNEKESSTLDEDTSNRSIKCNSIVVPENIISDDVNKSSLTSKRSILNDEKKSPTALDLHNEDSNNRLIKCNNMESPEYIISDDECYANKSSLSSKRSAILDDEKRSATALDLQNEDCCKTITHSVCDQINSDHKDNSLYLADDCKRLKINNSQILNKDFQGNDRIKQEKRFGFRKHHSSSFLEEDKQYNSVTTVDTQKRDRFKKHKSTPLFENEDKRHQSHELLNNSNDSTIIYGKETHQLSTCLDLQEENMSKFSKHNSSSSLESNDSICISDEELNYSSINSTLRRNRKLSVKPIEISDSDDDIAKTPLKASSKISPRLVINNVSIQRENLMKEDYHWSDQQESSNRFAQEDNRCEDYQTWSYQQNNSIISNVGKQDSEYINKSPQKGGRVHNVSSQEDNLSKSNDNNKFPQNVTGLHNSYEEYHNWSPQHHNNINFSNYPTNDNNKFPQQETGLHNSNEDYHNWSPQHHNNIRSSNYPSNDNNQLPQQETGLHISTEDCHNWSPQHHNNISSSNNSSSKNQSMAYDSMQDVDITALLKQNEVEVVQASDNPKTPTTNHSVLLHPRVRELSMKPTKLQPELFEDTFAKLLEQSDVICSIEKDVTPEKPLPITPDANVLVKVKDVTPMANYDAMSTPQVQQELMKFGLKKFKRQRGVDMLKYLYESTHPALEREEEDDDDTRVVKRRRKLVLDDPKVAEGSMEIVGDLINQGELEADMIFERRQSKKISSCRMPLHIAWHNLVTANKELHENILLYESLPVEVLYKMLKDEGMKYHIQDLITFLDKKCITIRINQNQGAGSTKRK